MVITGAKGFIGRQLALLVSDPIQIDKKTGKDIRDWSVVARAASQTDKWIHLAADSGVLQSYADPQKTFDNNVAGLVNSLEACRGYRAKRFVFASSGAVLQGTSPYAVSKQVGEIYCQHYEQFGLKPAILRFGNVYGPGSYDKSSVIAKMCKDAIDHGVITIEGDGLQTRDFIHINDVCNAIIDAAECSECGIFTIGSGEQHSISYIANIVSSLSGASIKHSPARRDDPQSNVLDINSTCAALSWRPLMSLDDGIEQTWEWFKRDYQKSA